MWPLIMGLLSSGAGAGVGGQAVAGGAAAGASQGGGGIMGMLGGLLGKNDQEMKDMAENAASEPGTPGMPLVTQGQHAKDMSQFGHSMLPGLISQASQGTRQGPGGRRQLPTLDLQGLLGGQYMVGRGR